MLKYILKHNNKTESIRLEQSRYGIETIHRENLICYSMRNNNQGSNQGNNQGNNQGSNQGNNQGSNQGNDVKTEP